MNVKVYLLVLVGRSFLCILMYIFADYIFLVALTSVLESRSHLAETRKSLIHLLGESQVHGVPSFIIAECKRKCISQDLC